MKKIYHYIFSTYSRGQILIGEIVDDLGQIFDEIAFQKSFKIIAKNILADHVHLLIEKEAIDQNEYIVKMIKGISSRRIFMEYPTNRFVHKKLWGRGYRAYEIKSGLQLIQTKNYIINQTVAGVDKRFRPDWKPRRSVAGFLSHNK
jgi:putative transposase